MKWWRVVSYWTEDGTEVLANWYAWLPPNIKADVEYYLRFLEITEDWFSTGEALDLERQHVGLTEIRFDAERKGGGKERYRLVGFIDRYPHRPLGGELQPGVFVVLLGCQKWKNKTAPPGAFDWAMELKRNLANGRGFTDDHTL